MLSRTVSASNVVPAIVSKSIPIISKLRHTGLFNMTKRGFLTEIPAYMKGVRMSFGKFDKSLGPGLNWAIPIYHKVYKVDMRHNVVDLKQQSVISSDGVTLYVDATAQYKIVDDAKAILNVSGVGSAVLERCQMQLRNHLSACDVNDILRKQGDISKQVTESLAQLEEEWGTKVLSVQIKNISFDESMRRAMATEAEAHRSAQAKVINAKADVETAEEYNKAAKIYAENPVTLRLREFQLWSSVSKNPASTIYVVPSNICDLLSKKN